MLAAWTPTSRFIIGVLGLASSIVNYKAVDKKGRIHGECRCRSD